jgi:hypothetical protein
MAVKYFQVKEELLSPKRLDELKEVIASRNMRVTNELSFMNAILVFDYEKKGLEGKEYKKAKKALMEQIKQCLDYIPVDEQVERCLLGEPLSDTQQRILAFIYNTMTGNYYDALSPRELHYANGGGEIVIRDRDLMPLLGVDDKKSLHVMLFSDRRSWFNIHVDTDEDDIGWNGFSSISLQDADDGDGKVVTIGFTKLLILLLPQYISRMVKPEYIDDITIEQVIEDMQNFRHYGSLQPAKKKVNNRPAYVITISNEFIERFYPLAFAEPRDGNADEYCPEILKGEVDRIEHIVKGGQIDALSGFSCMDDDGESVSMFSVMVVPGGNKHRAVICDGGGNALRNIDVP